MKEAVNHPDHYLAGKYEVINILETTGYSEDFCLGNTIKYVLRAGKKDKDKYKEDLSKALWYLERRLNWLSLSEDNLLNCFPFNDTQINVDEVVEAHSIEDVHLTNVLKLLFTMKDHDHYIISLKEAKDQLKSLLETL